MLALRVASAIIGVPIVLAFIWLGGLAFSIATAVILVVAVVEFYSLPRDDRRPRTTGEQASLKRLLRLDTLALLGVAFVALLAAGAHAGEAWWPGALTGAALLGWGWLVAQNRVDGALERWLWYSGGVLYVGWLGSHLILLRGMDNDGDWLFIAIGATFMADTGAYFIGRAFGKHRLAPEISPGKTIEGAIGGLIAGWGGLLLLNYLTGLRLSAAEAIPLGLLVVIAAIVGDLAESLLKRSQGVKDTGMLIPGHGGVLDRLDSILFVVVVIYYYGQWVVL